MRYGPQKLRRWKTTCDRTNTSVRSGHDCRSGPLSNLQAIKHPVSKTIVTQSAAVIAGEEKKATVQSQVISAEKLNDSSSAVFVEADCCSCRCVHCLHWPEVQYTPSNQPDCDHLTATPLTGEFVSTSGNLLLRSADPAGQSGECLYIYIRMNMLDVLIACWQQGDNKVI